MELFVVKLSCSFVLRKNFHERKLFCMTSSHNLQTQRNYSFCECFMCSRWQRTFCCYCLAIVSWKMIFPLSSLEWSAFCTAISATEYSMSWLHHAGDNNLCFVVQSISCDQDWITNRLKLYIVMSTTQDYTETFVTLNKVMLRGNRIKVGRRMIFSLPQFRTKNRVKASRSMK